MRMLRGAAAAMVLAACAAARPAAAPVARRTLRRPGDDTHPAAWARDLFRRDDWVLLDTETTGLDGGAEIIDLALLDRHGMVLLDTLLRPQRPIPPVVSRVHGLYDHHVRAAPTFPAIWPRLRAIKRSRHSVDRTPADPLVLPKRSPSRG